MEDDRQRWDRRYRGRPLSRPAAPDVFTERPDLLGVVPTSGRALDIACGPGSQTLWLAQRGLHVVALDVSTVAIDLTNTAASACGLEPSIDARVHDLDGGLPDDIQNTTIDVVVCQRFGNRQLYPSIVDVLRPCGVALITLLSVVGLDEKPGRFHAPPGELVHGFADVCVDVLHHSEAGGLASIVLQRRGSD